MSRPMARSRRVNAAILAQIERMMMLIAMVYGVVCSSDRSLHSKSTGQFLNGKKKDFGGSGAPNTRCTDTHRAHK